MSELSEVLNYAKFEESMKYFIKQAEDNAITKKSSGVKGPVGIVGKSGHTMKVSGKSLGQTFGHGAASGAPYFNWFVVSIYYIVSKKEFELGIERDIYPHVNKMKPIAYDILPKNKNNRIAVFYDTYKDKLDMEDLYENFIKICDQVYELGLEENKIE